MNIKLAIGILFSCPAYAQIPPVRLPNTPSEIPPHYEIRTIQPGDSVWKLFENAVPPSPERRQQWKSFRQTNAHIANLDLVYPGDQILLPRASVSQAPSPQSPPAINSGAPAPILPAPAPTPQTRLERITAFCESIPLNEYALWLSLLAFLWCVTVRPQVGGTIKWGAVVITAALGLRYILWRGFHTLNLEDPWKVAASWSLYLAELYGYVTLLLFYLQAVSPKKREIPELGANDWPSVDVFVTIYNESSDILYRTLVGCKALDYPAHQLTIYVLDDGRRQEIRALAERFACRYVTRPDNLHAKAGNINNGLKYSHGDVILLLDCDHIPVKSFLRETVPYFKDPKVALVQTPHHFYNPDTYQRNLGLEREVAHEQDLFFRILEPGRDSCNSAFFAGSSGLMRRSALVEIGGFKVRTVVEDLHTSMVLHSKGYRSVYVNKVLSAALSPETFPSYLKQRQRWTRGGVQMFILDNPLLRKGLSLLQRLNYLASLLFFFVGWPRFIYLVAPLSFLLFQYTPIQCQVPALVMNFLPYYIVSHVAFFLFTKEFRNPFWSDVYETAVCCATSWTALATILQTDRIIFHVTPKGIGSQSSSDRRPWLYATPHWALLGLLAAGAAVGTGHILAQGPQIDAVLLSFGWTAYNFILLGTVIQVSRERPQVRASYRVARQIPCELRFNGTSLGGRTCDLSETGLSLLLEGHHHLHPQVKMTLRGICEEEGMELAGNVVRNDWLASGQTLVGVSFPDIDERARQELLRQIYSAPDAWSIEKRPESAPLKSASFIAKSLIKSHKTFLPRKNRRWPRLAREIPCHLESSDKIWGAVTRELSSTGASVLLRSAGGIPANPLTLCLLPGDCREIRVKGTLVRTDYDCPQPVYGIRFLEPAHLDLRVLENS